MSVRLIKIVIWFSIVVMAIWGMKWLINSYSVSELQDAVEAYYWPIIAGYALLLSLRGLLFLPTMPVIIMMANSVDYWVMFSVTLSATCCSAYLVCLAVDNLDMHKKLNALPNKSIKRAQRWINSSGMAAVTGWAFFPFVFTDLIVYLARLSGMSYKQILLGVAIGEGLLIFIIIVTTEWLVNML